MNSKKEQTNSEADNLDNEISKEEQTNSEANNLDNEISKEKQKDSILTKEQSSNIKLDKKSIDIEDEYKFGWSSYSELTNGRFAMLGFLAIILIELISQQSFLKWAGIL